jgi:hypothetical protein
LIDNTRYFYKTRARDHVAAMAKLPPAADFAGLFTRR